MINHASFVLQKFAIRRPAELLHEGVLDMLPPQYVLLEHAAVEVISPRQPPLLFEYFSSCAVAPHTGYVHASMEE